MDICWGGGPSVQHSDQLGKVFPAMQLEFAGGVNLTLSPQNYLFAHFDRDGAYCLGVFANTQDGTLLGGITFRDVLVQVSPWQEISAHMPCICLCVRASAVEALHASCTLHLPVALHASAAASDKQGLGAVRPTKCSCGLRASPLPGHWQRRAGLPARHQVRHDSVLLQLATVLSAEWGMVAQQGWRVTGCDTTYTCNA